MLKIYNPKNASEAFPLVLDADEYFVTHKFNGFDTLTFNFDNSEKIYEYIVEENTVETDDNIFVVKQIDDHGGYTTVVCELDLTGWQKNVFVTYRSNVTLTQVLTNILPSGWSVIGDGQVAGTKWVEGNIGEPLKGVTNLQVLQKAESAYNCVFNFDVKNKILSVIVPSSFAPSGKFFTDELNLKSLGYSGNSQDLVTRLYGFGATDEEGNVVNFADINDGKTYVEDFTYSNKIISAAFVDDRFTVKENLLEATREKLKELSYPVRSYSCKMDKLLEGIWMYQVVTLIDRKHKISVNHQVVEYKEYSDHVNDTITLSASTPQVKTSIDKITNNLQNQIDQFPAKITTVIDKEIISATSAITGNNGGVFRWIFDNENKPIELVNLCDTEDIQTAQKVWRWNASGLGHSNNGYSGNYDLALLSDGSINATVITSGVLNANIVKAGTIMDATGNNYWNLETGEFSSQYVEETVFNSAVGISNEMQVNVSAIYKDIDSLKIDFGTIYVANTEFDEYKEQVSSSLSLTSNEFEVRISGAEQLISNVANDQQQFREGWSKYLRYGEYGLELGDIESPIFLRLENDKIAFKQGEKDLSYWLVDESHNEFHSGDLVVDVNFKAQFGNYAFVPRSDGSLMFLKVGG